MSLEQGFNDPGEGLLHYPPHGHGRGADPSRAISSPDRRAHLAESHAGRLAASSTRPARQSSPASCLWIAEQSGESDRGGESRVEIVPGGQALR